MSKRSKIFLAITIPILVLVLVLYFLVDAVYVPEPEVLAYPQGELTQSIFTEQNNSYEKNESLPNTHTFANVPFMADIPEGDGAIVGSGTIYQVAESVFVYMTEYNDAQNVQEIISSQFPSALMINYVPDFTRITVQADQQGFINGFAAEYIADQIFVSDSAATSEAVILGYALDVPGEEYAGNNLFIGVGTTELENDRLAVCGKVLSAIMKTVREDEYLAKQRRQDAESAAKQAEKKRQEEMDALKDSAREVLTELPEGVQEETEEAPVEQEQESVVTGSTPQTLVLPITAPSDASGFILNVSWPMPDYDIILELFSPDGTMFYDPADLNEYEAVFIIDPAEPGAKYELHLLNHEDSGGVTTSVSGYTG